MRVTNSKKTDESVTITFALEYSFNKGGIVMALYDWNHNGKKTGLMII